MTDLKFSPSKIFNNANKTIEAYHLTLSPLCKKTGIPPLALDILLFIANNPDNATAKDVCRLRGFKSGIVSVHVERLVSYGLLDRVSDGSDRRKVILKPTEKSSEIIEDGQRIQKEFAAAILNGLSKEDLELMRNTMIKIENNVDSVIKEYKNV